MKFAVTGIGITNGLGDSLQQNWGNLLAGNTAIKEITWPEDNPKKFPKTHKSLTVKIGAPCTIPEFEETEFNGAWQHWDPCVKIAVKSAKDAILDSKLETKNVAVVYSSIGGSLFSKAYLHRNLEDGKERSLPRQTIQASLDYISGLIARTYKFTGSSSCINSACSTGLMSIDYGIKTLLTELDIDAVLVGGADMPLEAYQSYYFQNLGALSPTESKPFDVNRSGFVAGEGAGALIIEPLEKAVKRGAKIYAIIAGIGSATYGDHDTAPDTEGIGSTLAATRALKNAGINASDIAYINAHATGTIAGDDIEFNAMKKLFPNTTMVANKGQIGHTLAASGIIETIYTIMAIKNQITPPTVNLENPVGEGMSLPRTASHITAKYAIKNNFAFGGRSACAIIERYDE
jgi:3-oxoacyl-[acyl-carrier-protein] synthase II